MGLITCRDCKKQISDTAKTCPLCGRRWDAGIELGGYSDELWEKRKKEIEEERQLKKFKKKFIIILLVILWIIGAIVYGF